MYEASDGSESVKNTKNMGLDYYISYFIWLSIQLKIHVKILPKNVTDEIDIKSGSKMYDLLKKINLKPDNIIILRDNTPVPVDDILTNEQELTIIQVASGG